MAETAPAGTTLTRDQFLAGVRDKQLQVSSLPANLQAAARPAADSTGVIRGEGWQRFWNAADGLDRNGSRRSIVTRTGNEPTPAGAMVEAAMDPARLTPAPAEPEATTTTRTQFLAQVGDKQLRVSALPENLQEAGRRAADRDGIIRGAGWDRYFDAADALDRNGRRQSLVSQTGNERTPAGAMLAGAAENPALERSTAPAPAASYRRGRFSRDISPERLAEYTRLGNEIRAAHPDTNWRTGNVPPSAAYDRLLQMASEDTGVPAATLRGVLRVESGGGDYLAVSTARSPARGAMQIKQVAWEHVQQVRPELASVSYGDNNFANAFNPGLSVLFGASYFRMRGAQGYYGSTRASANRHYARQVARATY